MQSWNGWRDVWFDNGIWFHKFNLGDKVEHQTSRIAKVISYGDSWIVVRWDDNSWIQTFYDARLLEFNISVKA